MSNPDPKAWTETQLVRIAQSSFRITTCDGTIIALLPAGGMVTMNPETAARAAALVGAQVAVPMHYGRLPFTGGAGRKFARLWAGTTVLA